MSQRETDAVLVLLALCWDDPEAGDGTYLIFQRRARVTVEWLDEPPPADFLIRMSQGARRRIDERAGR